VQKSLTLSAVGLLIAGCGGYGDTAVTTQIGAVQGPGLASPLAGQTVTVEGIVSGDFQSGDSTPAADLSGFYLLGSADGDADTSDGLFVYEQTSMVDVAVNDRVRVTGKVTEFHSETQLIAADVEVLGRSRANPVPLTLPGDVTINSDGYPIADLERFEGMLVRIDQPLTVSETYGLDRYGELMLTAQGRVISYTNTSAPSKTGYKAFMEDMARRSIMLDDGNNAADVRPVRFLESSDSPVRVGDQVTGLTGVLRYSRGAGASGPENWRLVPTESPTFTTTNPRIAAPDTAGNLRVASFNVLNLFTTIDIGKQVCGPRESGSCRGADSAEEYARQLGKIGATLAAIDADIVGLVELENNARASLDAIVQVLDQRGLDYRYVDTGTIGGDSIKVGLIYKPERVAAIGDFAVLDQSVDSRFIDRKSRPVLAQTFELVDGGGRLTVAVNHLKSKGSDCDDLGDPDLGDGAGNCNKTRTRAAAAMVDWLAGDPTGSGDADVLIVGDLNTHFMEDPAQAIIDAGYDNLLSRFHGTDSYSFVFRGQSGALDHAFASRSLAPQVIDTAAWAINADESRLLDYNTEGQRDPIWFKGDDPFRSSDHDPLIIGIELTP